MPLLKFREEILKICFLPFFINHVQYKLANNCVGLEKPMLQNYQILPYGIQALYFVSFAVDVFSFVFPERILKNNTNQVEQSVGVDAAIIDYFNGNWLLSLIRSIKLCLF